MPAHPQLIIEALQEGGLPAGVVNCITNAPEDAAKVVDAMVAHPAVRRVNFTGSTRVGKLIAASCARHLKPVVLGGKAPFVVLDDADLDAAVAATAYGAFANSGQICMPAEWLIVDTKSPTTLSPASRRRPPACRWAIHAGRARWCWARWPAWARSRIAMR